MKKTFGWLILLCMVLALAGCSSGGGTTSATEPAAATEVPAATEEPAATEAPAEQAASAGLTIDIGALSAEPEFIDWDQDGTAMQIIAFKDSSGAVQLAYNTCQVCAGSPYAYFEYSNGVLMCMNCGNRFGLASVGKVSGGCNPKPLAEYQVEGDAVVISEETLAQAAASFRNWKVFQ
ncbi:MAG: Fe-S-containing protein [Candidatus Faecivicinus sp.]